MVGATTHHSNIGLRLAAADALAAQAVELERMREVLGKIASDDDEPDWKGAPMQVRIAWRVSRDQDLARQALVKAGGKR